MSDQVRPRSWALDNVIFVDFLRSEPAYEGCVHTAAFLGLVSRLSLERIREQAALAKPVVCEIYGRLVCPARRSDSEAQSPAQSTVLETSLA